MHVCSSKLRSVILFLEFFMSILMIRIKFIIIPIHRRNAILIIISEVPLLLRVTFTARYQPQLERMPEKNIIREPNNQQVCGQWSPGHFETLSRGLVLELRQPGVVRPQVLGVARHQRHVVLVLAVLRPRADTEDIVTQAAVRPVVPVLVT